jgi:hypothetical protein
MSIVVFCFFSSPLCLLIFTALFLLVVLKQFHSRRELFLCSGPSLHTHEGGHVQTPSDRLS